MCGLKHQKEKRSTDYFAGLDVFDTSLRRTNSVAIGGEAGLGRHRAHAFAAQYERTYGRVGGTRLRRSASQFSALAAGYGCAPQITPRSKPPTVGASRL